MEDRKNVGVGFIRPEATGVINVASVGVRFIEPERKLPKRKQVRLKSYDYQSDGYYFVTICTHSGRPNIRQYREVVKRILLSMPKQFSGLEIDWYVLMPTHLHMIFVFNGMKVGLSEVVRRFKALVSRETGIKFWQRNYYEHVIRNEAILLKIREYIENNPLVDRIKFEDLY